MTVLVTVEDQHGEVKRRLIDDPCLLTCCGFGSSEIGDNLIRPYSFLLVGGRGGAISTWEGSTMTIEACQ